MKSPTSDGSDPVRVSSLLLAYYLYNVCYAEDRTLIDSHPHIFVNLSVNKNLHPIHKATQFYALDPRLLEAKQTSRLRACKSVECTCHPASKTKSSDISWCGFAQISAQPIELVSRIVLIT